MDWTTIITCVVGAIAGGGLTSVFLLPQTKSSKNIENESKQSEEWKKLYHEAKATIDVKDEKIESLFAEIRNQMTESLQRQKENAELSVENTRLCILKCERPACQQRTPPTGF